MLLFIGNVLGVGVGVFGFVGDCFSLVFVMDFKLVCVWFVGGMKRFVSDLEGFGLVVWDLFNMLIWLCNSWV